MLLDWHNQTKNIYDLKAAILKLGLKVLTTPENHLDPVIMLVIIRNKLSN